MKKCVAALLAVVFLGPSLAHGFPAVEVYKKASPSVVLIVSGNRGSGKLLGAGSLVADDGLVVTSAHVVVDRRTSRPYRNIRVYSKPEKVTGSLNRDLEYRHESEVLAYDTGLDIALLRVRDLPRELRVIPFADPEEIMVGEEVVAIGHPEQGGLWSLTYGRISGQVRDQGNIQGKDVYQTDTSVNRGNSGGPLLDRRGYLVGVNTNIARKGAGGLTITGVNFALKSSVVRSWLDRRGYHVAYGTKSLSEKGEASPALREEPSLEEDREKAEEPPEMPASPLTEEEPAKPAEKDKELPGAEDEDMESDTILTPKNPYTYDDLFNEVEKEMENMMEEMKKKIRER